MVRLESRSSLIKRARAVLRAHGPLGVLAGTYAYLRDAYEVWRLPSGVRPMVPPKSHQYHSGGNFAGTGRRMVRVLVDPGGLKPEDDVLDVGCGIGRVAAQLTPYISAEGSYTGFDAIPFAIDWCRRQISSRRPNFRFDLIDLRNEAFHPEGKVDAATLTFPYEDKAFSFVCCLSVVLYLLPPETDRYFAEIARVLRPGGRCVVTTALMNQDALEWLTRTNLLHTLGPDTGGYVPMKGGLMAHHESTLSQTAASHGLRLALPILYGRWPGRPRGVSQFDVLIFERSDQV